MAFRGQYEHSLDAKDRLTVPARWRAPLADGVVLFKGIDPCIEVFAEQDFQAFTDRVIAGLNPLSSKGRALRRRFHSLAHDESLDSAGRVRLPRHLIEHAGLDSGCVIAGVDDHLEIWSQKEWSEHVETLDREAAGMAEELAREMGAEGAG